MPRPRCARRCFSAPPLSRRERPEEAVESINRSGGGPAECAACSARAHVGECVAAESEAQTVRPEGAPVSSSAASAPTPDFRTEAHSHLGDLIALRRRLHANPELGYDLPFTQQAVLDELAGLGLEITTGESLTSV